MAAIVIVGVAVVAVEAAVVVAVVVEDVGASQVEA